MAEVETKMTIKLSKAEFKVLEKILHFEYINPSDSALFDYERDLANNIFFCN